MARRSSPVIVGRDPELSEITAARERAAGGRPQIVLVRGDAGIGKSRLVDEAADRAQRDGDILLHGGCLDLEGDGVPYLPIVAALRGLARSLGDAELDRLLGPDAGDLAPVLPDRNLRAGSGIIANAAATPDRQREGVGSASGSDRARLFERFLGLLGRLSQEAPVFAVIEDVQWIDPATRDLLTFLVRNVTTERVAAVLTCRTDDLPRGHPVASWLAEIGRVPAANRIDLTPLAAADVVRQLEAIAGGPIDPATAETIARRSDGHPLFAEELLAAGSPDEAPPSLVDMLLERVLSLDELALGVVRASAVVGGSIDEPLIARVLDQPESAVAEAVRRAAARSVLVASGDGPHTFRHQLFREVVERELSAGERRRFHERIAEALEAGVPRAPEATLSETAELARHWYGANRPVEAFRTAVAAAAAAERKNAFEDAHRLLERAILLEPRLPADRLATLDERVDLRRRAATVADLAGDVARAIALVDEALKLADAAADPTTSGLLHARRGYLTWASGGGEAALEEHERAVALVPASPATAERANVLGGLAGALMGLGRFAASRPVAEEAVATAVAARAMAEECRGRMTLGSDLVALGEIEQGLEQLRRAHELAGADRTELLVVTGHNLALNLLAADRLDEALDIAARTRATTRAGGLERRYGMDLAAVEADIRFRLDQWDEADEITRAGLALDQGGRGSPYLAIVRARLAANRGDVDEADRRLAAVTIADLDPDVAVIHAVASVETALVRRDPRSAADLAAGALAVFAGTGTEAWAAPLIPLGLRASADLAETAHAEHNDVARGGARMLADAITAHEAEIAESGIAATQTGRAWLATAHAERERAAGAETVGSWTAAVRAWDDARGRFGAADARLRLATARLRSEGVKADVQPLLEAAWRTAVELGAEPLRDEIETAARRARVSLVPAASDDVRQVPAVDAARPSRAEHRLSAREIEVLRLVAAGRSNGEIGDELFITRKTAGVHVTHILDKLGVSNRVEAAMVAARLGLIDDVIEGAGVDLADEPRGTTPAR